MSDLDGAISGSRRMFSAFAARCQSGESAYRLTPSADESPYARCFGVYCRHLTQEPFSPALRASLAGAIRMDVRKYRARNIDPGAKAFRQLLTFSLSALSVLDALTEDPLEELVNEQIPKDVRVDLDKYGCLSGVPGSGNQAMFTAILLLHARDHLQRDTAKQIQDWVTLHVEHMNRFGFWGRDAGMTHLQFQNGYHQHEILEYLGVAHPRKHELLAAVRSLADREGHFAPYPGGGGCYDYDAAFLLTPGGTAPDSQTRALLERVALTLLAEQCPDGGFAESLRVRPRNPRTFARTLAHAARGLPAAPLFAERLRYGLTLQRPKHDRIHTHWSVYSRGWDESDLWDSWFRMMTLARVQIAADPAKAPHWGFINYPGIGYHPFLQPGRPA